MTARDEFQIEVDNLYPIKPGMLSSSTVLSENCKIRKVKLPDGAHENTRSLYTPKIISIGPLHHGKPELESMEDLKKMNLNNLLNHQGSWNAELSDRLTIAGRRMETLVRDNYEELPPGMSKQKFVHMLVIDGCFLLKFLSKKEGDVNDLGWPHRSQIDYDILLFENQIPFFVLEKFYSILNNQDNFRKVAYDYMNKVTNNRTFLHDRVINETNVMSTEPSNLLHLYHMMLFSTNHQPQHLTRKWANKFFSSLFSFVPDLIYKIFFADNSHIMYPTSVASATVIEEAGVRFQRSLMELRFEEGTLLIPVLTMNKQSLCLLKNLIILESYHRSVVSPYVHTYVSFLSLLIKNPGDMKVMEKHHIISGGGDESFKLLDDLLQAGIFSIALGNLSDWQSPSQIETGLVNYCQEPRHRWWAKLMKDYFGNPWAILGVLAGFILLFLTTFQTVLHVLSYHQQTVKR